MRAAARRSRCATSPASRSSSPASAEKLDGLEPFHPERMASRILGMGDILSLVEEAHAKVDVEEAQKLADKFKKGNDFDLDDFKSQLRR